MCGILVWLNKDKGVQAERFASALRLLDHRGPDAQQMLFFDHLSPDGPRKLHKLGASSLPSEPQLGALGHTRLSILDLRELAHQPLISQDGRHCLIYNGEIYNYKEERAQRGLEDQCESSSDSEVLFRALIQDGPSCLKTMNGMWALAFADFENETLFLSRDQFGKKPLFIYSDESNFIASSEVKSIYKILDITRQINSKVLSGYFLGKLTPTFDDGETIYKGIRFLPGGANLRLNLRDLSFKISHENDLSHWLSQPARVEDFQDEMENAVKLRLRSDVPIAIPVSGGVDSSIVATYAHKHSTGENSVQFFTILNYDDDGNPKPDLQYARELTKALGVPLTEIELPIDEEQVYPQFEHMIKHYEFTQNPFLISWPTYLLNKQMSAEGIKVILDGTGGDEVLGGYPNGFHTVAENLASNRKLGKAIDLWNYWDSYKQGAPWPRARGYLRLLKLAALKGKNRISHEKKAMGSFQPYLKDEIFQQHCEGLVETFFKRHHVQSMKDYQLFDIKNYLLPYGLYVNDQCAMIWSMENRSPLLDINLVKYVNLPNRDKCQGGYNKYFLRKALPEPTPSSIRWRRNKMGMGISPHFFFKSHRKIIQDSIMSSPLAAEAADLDQVYNDMQSGELPDIVLRGLFGLALLDQNFDCSLS